VTARWVWTCALLLVIDACASHQGYPRQWPPFAQHDQRCTVLSGEYRNEGKTPEGYATSLSGLLLNEHALIDRLTLSVQQGDGHLVVRAEIPQRDPVTLSEDDVSCRSGVLVVRPRGHWFVTSGAPELPLFAIGKRSTTLELRSVENGLVVRVKGRASGVLVAIPYTHSDETWHRFERVSPV
jgi:hypothetical protein